MARNRRRDRGVGIIVARSAQVALSWGAHNFSRGLKWAVLGGALVGAGFFAHDAVHASPYFVVRVLDASPSAHVALDQIRMQAGLEGPVNIFDFDPEAVERRLLEDPWIAEVTVERKLPDRVKIRWTERASAGVVVAGGLYLVDDSGRTIVEPTPRQSLGLPLVTGLRVESLGTPETQARIREALALARMYERSPLSVRYPLSDVHVASGGRMEIQVGRTRVALGRGDYASKLVRLERVLHRARERKVDAEYVLLSEDQRRAIVKETPRVEPDALSPTAQRRGG